MQRRSAELLPTEEWAARAEKAYADAEAALAQHGVASNEARLAWEVVDDVEMGMSSIASLVPKPLDEECDVELDEAKCRDFEAKMNRLEELAASAKAVNYQIKYEILKLQQWKAVTGAPSPAAAVRSDAYGVAKAAAEAAGAQHGAKSKEAAVAWEAVFEVVAAADDDTVSMASLEDECLVSSSEKCKEYNSAMANLNKAIAGK